MLFDVTLDIIAVNTNSLLLPLKAHTHQIISIKIVVNIKYVQPPRLRTPLLFSFDSLPPKRTRSNVRKPRNIEHNHSEVSWR